MWVRVAATNSLGDGAKSASSKFRCTKQAAAINVPIHVNGSDGTITVRYAAEDTILDPKLYGASLLGFKISHAAAKDSAASSWHPFQSLVVGPEHRQYTLSGLLP